MTQPDEGGAISDVARSGARHAARPLEGVVVLDFTRFLPGPMATQMLADLGAEVIKIEGFPHGDPTRGMTPRTGFLSVNRDKKSLLVDFATAQGRAVLERLVARADVFVEVSRPGSMEKLGLDYASVRQTRPDIVYCSVSAVGQFGPDCSTPAHGMNIDALAGALAVHEAADGSSYVPADYPYLSSLLTAHSTAVGICAALVRRAQTGEGAFLDASCWDSALAGNPVTNATALNDAPRAEGLASRLTPKYAPYKTRDGRHLMVCCIERKFWSRLCEILGRPDLITAFDRPQEDGQDPGAWGEGSPWVYDEVAAVIATKDLVAWEAVFAGSGLPVTPVRTRKEALESPHATQREMVVRGVDPQGDTFLTPGPAWIFDGQRNGGSRVPRLGQDTAEVLSSAGYTPAEVEALRSAGVVG